MRFAAFLRRKAAVLAALFRDRNLLGLVLLVLVSKRLPSSLVRLRAGVITQSRSIPPFPPPTHAICQRLRLDDIPRLSVPARPGHSSEAVRARFARDLRLGRDGFVALVNDEVVAYSWAMYDEYSIPGMRLTLSLGSNEAYTGNSYVVPGYRYTRVYAGLAVYVLRYLEERGVRWFYGYTYVTNRHSIRTHTRMGYQIVGWVMLAELPGVDLQLTRLRWDGDRVRWRFFRRAGPHVTTTRPSSPDELAVSHTTEGSRP